MVFEEWNSVGDFDNVLISMRFHSGALGSVEVSRNALYGYDIRSEVLGSEGAVMIGAWQQTPVLLLTRQGASHDVMRYIIERFSDAYLAKIIAHGGSNREGDFCVSDKPSRRGSGRVNI